MNIKRITFDFHTGSPRMYEGWIYYMASGKEYKVYQMLPDQKDHVLLATFRKDEVKSVTEVVL